MGSCAVSGGVKMYQNRRFKNVGIKKGVILRAEVTPGFFSGFDLIFHAIAFPFYEDRFGMMQETVEKG